MQFGHGSRPIAIMGLLGILLLPLAAQTPQPNAKAAQEQKRSCWLRDIASPTPSAVYAMCEQGTMWSTIDSGGKWEQRETGAPASLRALAFLDANRGIAVGKGGLIIGTDDGGKTWSKRPSNTTENLMEISFVGDQGWVAAYAGKILHTTDGGKTWTEQKTGTRQTLETIYFHDAQHGWAAGWAGTILRTSDGGATWETLKADKATWSVSSIYFKDNQNGWLVGFAGQILHTKDAGTNWTVQESPVKSVLTSITFGPGGRGWITYDEGFVVSEDGGETWKENKTTSRYFVSRTVQVGDTLWALGQSVVLRRVGNDWKKIDSLVVDKTINFTAEPVVPAAPAGTR